VLEELLRETRRLREVFRKAAFDAQRFRRRFRKVLTTGDGGMVLTNDEEYNSKLRLLYISCGVDDALIAPNRKTVEWLKSKGAIVTAVETEGAHTWMVWRRNLAEFAGKLFKD